MIPMLTLFLFAVVNVNIRMARCLNCAILLPCANRTIVTGGTQRDGERSCENTIFYPQSSSSDYNYHLVRCSSSHACRNAIIYNATISYAYGTFAMINATI